jgi:MoaA/NifB/PqqE/SkfB family radical SAM enzyme
MRGMRRVTRLKSYYREFKFIVKGLLWTDHPLLAHIIPIRRCNLSCAYCNEYDTYSKPIPLDVMYRRIDKLAELGTAAITISGGEPLLHPGLESIIARIRKHGILAALITNGYLLTRDRIVGLNEAGLEYLQISIDNVEPDEVSKKSLKVLDKKLELLKELADFKVHINTVLGSGVRNPEDAFTIAKRALELGFSNTVGVIHDGLGTLSKLKPLDGIEREVYFKIKSLERRWIGRFDSFQRNLIDGKPNNWRCRAGARYLYICEDGLVHYCSQQRGYPAIPLEEYSREHLRREYLTKKACAPYCTISCVQQIAMFDNWRDEQTLEPKGAAHREVRQVDPTRQQLVEGFVPATTLRAIKAIFDF